jgi:hypothetical protein
MKQDPEIIALQRRVEALERMLRAGVAVNPGGGGVAESDSNKYIYYSDLYSAYSSIVGKIIRVGEDEPLLNTSLSSIGKNVTIGYCVSEVATIGGSRVSKILLEGIIDDPTAPTSSKYYVSETGTITGTIPSDGCPMVIGNGVYDSEKGYQLYFKPEYPDISIVKLATYEVGMTVPTLADRTIFGIY